ncbi:glycoside hydrolase [Phlegmacium glaucopus]|nr:glycoside hydrolase [Phlegmacium glaucopus]
MWKILSKFKQQDGRNDADLHIFHYRKQKGINVGSWFVLERWITDSPFENAFQPAQSDLDVARGRNSKKILEKHWDTWITEEDWAWIAERGINTLRIPIGYYHLCGADPSVLHGTDFQPFQEVYAGAWSRIVRAIETAHRYGIGVLLDLHAAPGKQNNDAHGGTSEKANFFNGRHNQHHTIRILQSLVNHLRQLESRTNIVGIELLNEPNPPSDRVLQTWYTSAITALRSQDPTIPIYIGECWRPEVYADYISHIHSSSSLTVLDHHLYRCFTSSDIHTTAADHTHDLREDSASTPRMLATISEKLGRVGGGIVIGEWSGALNPGSLQQPGAESEEKREFVSAQLALFDKYCGGWFFWTYKKEKRGDTGWSWQDAVEGGIFPTSVGIKYRRIEADDIMKRSKVRDEMKDDALEKHSRHWSQYPGYYDHSRFSSGFIVGWDDAYAFIQLTPIGSITISEIGFKGAWAMKRTSDHGKSYWEFEHGFMQGVACAVDDFRASCM